GGAARAPAAPRARVPSRAPAPLPHLALSCGCEADQRSRLRHFGFSCHGGPRPLHSFPTRRSSDLAWRRAPRCWGCARNRSQPQRSEEHTSELQSRENLVCRLLLEKKTRSAAPSARAPERLPPAATSSSTPPGVRSAP